VSPTNRYEQHLKQLRAWKIKPERDYTLSFLPRAFKQQVEQPHRQLAAIVPLWTQLVPPDVRDHTRLDSLNRGVLRVAVDSSAWLYELDRLLRSGLKDQIIAAHRSPTLRRIQLRVARFP
jgi:hypothetical protein